MARADVIIVGAGVVGAAVAWHLPASWRVVLLEQAAQPASEASAQNAGMVRRLVADAVERALAVRSVERMADVAGSGGPRSRGDWAERPFLRRTGSVVAVGSRRVALEQAAVDLARRGVRVDALDGAEVGRVAPAMQGSPVKQAWWLPGEAVADAWSLTMGFLAGARRRGAELLLGARARRLVVEDGRIAGVQVGASVIHAPRVVLAGGAWSSRLAATADVDRHLAPLARHLLHTRPHPLSTTDHPWCWVDDAGVYVRPEGGGFLVSPCDEELREPPLEGGSAGPVQALGAALADDRLQKWFPALAPVRLASGWTGLRTFAPDRRPVLGEDPIRPGLWWAAGLGGAGVTCAFAAGELVASLMEGVTPDWIDAASLLPGRVPPRP